MKLNCLRLLVLLTVGLVVGLMDDPSVGVRTMATNALQRIAPEALRKTESL